jgi:hypothetical protein
VLCSAADLHMASLADRSTPVQAVDQKGHFDDKDTSPRSASVFTERLLPDLQRAQVAASDIVAEERADREDCEEQRDMRAAITAEASSQRTENAVLGDSRPVDHEAELVMQQQQHQGTEQLTVGNAGHREQLDNPSADRKSVTTADDLCKAHDDEGGILDQSPADNNLIDSQTQHVVSVDEHDAANEVLQEADPVDHLQSSKLPIHSASVPASARDQVCAV